MGFKNFKNKRNSHSLFLILMTLTLFLMAGLVTAAVDNQSSDQAEEIPIIEGFRVYPTATETLLVIVNSASADYTTFGLVDPPRVIIDINGLPKDNLENIINVNRGHIQTITLQKGHIENRTRVVIELSDVIEYKVSDFAKTIKLTLLPTKPLQKSEFLEKGITVSEGAAVDVVKYQPQEPRVIFEPKATKLNQILGVDFTMLEQGRSQLTITTNKKTPYDLDRVGEKDLLLNLTKTTIPDLLLRHIDTLHFHGSLEKIFPSLNNKTNDVALKIVLKELVPFHVKQTDTAITIEFGPTHIKPPEKKIIPLKLAQARAEMTPSETRPTGPSADQTPAISSSGQTKKYTGEKMYLDFGDADVTNILRLINEISKENIIWDPAIAGRKVSMILKGVPWDEALDLILKNNDLAKRYMGENIIWITTKAKMNQILAEEEAEERKKVQRFEEQESKISDLEKKKKEDEPLVTDFIPVDFAAAGDIKGHIVLSTRGKMSIDTRTNTIIINDLAAVIEEAKKTVRQFDTPVKQIMIEARIVDATEDLSRDLGLKWGSDTSWWRRNDTFAVTVPAKGEDLPTDGKVFGGSFSTNSPTGWLGNIALNLAKDWNFKEWLTLSAQLALAEAEGKGRVISAPKVIAREGTAASISSGDSIIIPATENVASTTLDATLSLTVTPTTVSYNNFITLDVSVTDDSAPSSSRLLRKSISTTLMVKSGETVVIGGIIKENESKDQTGIPLVKDIPGLGWLFKAQRKVHNKSELLIFLTPTVLPTPAKPLS